MTSAILVQPSFILHLHMQGFLLHDSQLTTSDRQSCACSGHLGGSLLVVLSVVALLSNGQFL